MAARRGHRGDPGGEHAHGLGHGVAGAAVAAWPAVALVGSYELLLMIIRGVQVPADVTTGAWLSGRLPDADPLQMQAEDLFADDLAAGRVPSVRVIRTRLHVGQSRAQRAQAYLASLAPHSRLERRSNVHRHVGVRERQDRPSRQMQCQRRSHAKDPLTCACSLSSVRIDKALSREGERAEDYATGWCRADGTVSRSRRDVITSLISGGLAGALSLINQAGRHDCQ